MSSKLATPAAAVVAVVAFGLAYLVTQSPGISLAAAALLCLATYLFLERRTAEDFDTEAYLAKARKGMAEVEHEVERIQSLINGVREEGLTQGVQDPATRRALTAACTDLRAILRELRDDRSSNELHTQTAKLRVVVGSVRESLEFYIPMEADPDGFPDGRNAVEQGRARYQRFAEATRESLHAVRRNDVARYESTLATVAPAGPRSPRIAPRRENP